MPPLLRTLLFNKDYELFILANKFHFQVACYTDNFLQQSVLLVVQLLYMPEPIKLTPREFANFFGVARPKQGTSTKYGINLCHSMERSIY